MEQQTQTSLDDAWAQTEVKEMSFEPVAPGSYRAKVTGAIFEQGKDGKPDRVQFEYTITDVGPFTNQKVWENNQITEQGIQYLVNNFEKLGLEKPAKIGQIADVLQAAYDKEVKIKVTNKRKTDGSGVWVNAFIEEQVSPEDVPF